MTLTKAHFAESLFEELGLDRREAKALVELFFEEIKDSLEQGKPVKISGFGNFELRDKPVVQVGIQKLARKLLYLPDGW